MYKLFQTHTKKPHERKKITRNVVFRGVPESNLIETTSYEEESSCWDDVDDEIDEIVRSAKTEQQLLGSYGRKFERSELLRARNVSKH